MLLPAHSHRDSDLDEPLVWALEHGFASVEADVWFVDGDLRIGHERDEVDLDRTLENVYLEPLFRAARDGRIAGTITLLVDIKNEPEQTYHTIRRQLEPHRKLLSNSESPIRVLFSGDRPIQLVSQDANRMVFLDGRLPDIGADRRLFPTVSLDWHKLFTWTGEGAMPSDIEGEVRRLAERTHAAGQALRFWGTREDPQTWAALLNLGVDLINGDDVVAMTTFLTQYLR